MRSLSLLIMPGLLLVVLLVIGCGPDRTEDDLLRSATKLHAEDDFEGAMTEFQMLIEKYPKSDKVPEALYAMAVISLNKQREYSKAESLFTRLALEFPEDPTASSAAYQRARIYVDHLHKPDSAILAYEYFLERYPNAMSAPSARSELSELKKPVKPSN